jgi:hypothetical protein
VLLYRVFSIVERLFTLSIGYQQLKSLIHHHYTVCIIVHVWRSPNNVQYCVRAHFQFKSGYSYFGLSVKAGTGNAQRTVHCAVFLRLMKEEWLPLSAHIVPIWPKLLIRKAFPPATWKRFKLSPPDGGSEVAESHWAVESSDPNQEITNYSGLSGSFFRIMAGIYCSVS